MIKSFWRYSQNGLSFFLKSGDLVKRRGYAYMCAVLDCAYTGEKTPCRHHVLRCHRELTEVPAYCRLCSYKAFDENQLERHVKSFGPHKKARSRMDPEIPDSDFFVFNKSPRDIQEGVDYYPQSKEQSQSVWSQSGETGKRPICWPERSR